VSPAPPPAATALGESLLARGATIGRFAVRGLVGKGGMGEVYAAYDPELDRTVAIKLLRARSTRDGDPPEGRSRLMREAQAIARVSHPNVVVVYEAGTFQDRVFIAMEFVEGHTLGYWMHARQRTWPEVLEVFAAAGRGLAAAHERELVHRDFKPDNVMVGADGHVRVMDFGLVQVAIDRDKTPAPADVAPAAAAAAPAIVSSSSSTPGGPADDDIMATRVLGASVTDPLAGNASPKSPQAGLTRTGATLGTPAYMSPEQFRGEPTDARADQYSFCVALYEALYGERPTAGGTLQELSENVVAGRIRRPPASTKVPRWIRKALLRGLQVDPCQRWPSMTALLEELEKSPEKANRRRFTKAAAGKLAGVWETPFGERPVETSAKAEVRHAFLATGKVYAAKAFDGISQILDRYVKRWTELYVEAGEATHVRGEQSAEVLDLRMACLHEALEDLKALCGMFRQATPEVVENAVNAANALPSLDRCEDVELLRAAVKPPADAGTREAVAQLRSHLAEARALARVGRINDGLAAVAPLEAEVRKVGYAPLLADTLITAGLLHFQKGAMAESAAAFEEATWAAELARYDEGAAEAATYLVYIAGHHQGRFDAAEIWSRLAETLLRRMGGHDLLWGWLFNNRAALREAQGRVAEALEDARRGVAAKEKALGPDDPDLGLTVGNMALYLDVLGDPHRAVEHAQRAAEIIERGLGPDHPNTATQLTNYGEFLVRIGRFGEARDAAARSLAIFERETDPEGRYVAYPLLVIGLSHLGLDRPDLALPILERAARIREAKESLPVRRAEVRFALARALAESGQDRARALALAARARDEYRQAPPTPETRRELVAIERWLTARDTPPAEPRPSV
jgi:serine/threonine protein kinase/tetratricopeptide (TPR) repeat protein